MGVSFQFMIDNCNTYTAFHINIDHIYKMELDKIRDTLVAHGDQYTTSYSDSVRYDRN